MTTDYVTLNSGLQIPAVDRELNERIAELEFALEGDWINISSLGGQATEFSRDALQSIVRLARIMYLKNPLIARGVNVPSDYIWGRGLNINAKQEELNDLIQAFLSDHRNLVEFTSQQARIQKDKELRIDGNIFFAFFIHPITGHIRVGTFPVEEIISQIKNPKDRKEVWYYKRRYQVIETNLVTGTETSRTVEEYNPDWRYNPQEGFPSAIGAIPVVNTPIYHIRIGGFSDWDFGVSEVYSALDWAKAYKTFLENWSTIVAAYARYAFKLTTVGGASGIQKAKDKLNTTLAGSRAETNPPALTGSTFIAAKDQVTLDPIRTAGATTSADDARRLLLMVAASFGLPESFFGDVQGTFATADSLDRPTELAFVNRQTLWADIYHAIIDYVIFWAIKAPRGVLTSFGSIEINEYGESYVVFNEDFDDHVDIDFPPVLEHSVKDQMSALVQGATFDGKPLTVIPDAKLLAKMVLTILGENDIDELLEDLYPEDEDQAVSNQLGEAANELREAISRLANALSPIPV